MRREFEAWPNKGPRVQKGDSRLGNRGASNFALLDADRGRHDQTARVAWLPAWGNLRDNPVDGESIGRGLDDFDGSPQNRLSWKRADHLRWAKGTSDPYQVSIAGWEFGLLFASRVREATTGASPRRSSDAVELRELSRQQLSQEAAKDAW